MSPEPNPFDDDKGVVEARRSEPIDTPKTCRSSGCVSKASCANIAAVQGVQRQAGRRLWLESSAAAGKRSTHSNPKRDECEEIPSRTNQRKGPERRRSEIGEIAQWGAMYTTSAPIVRIEEL